MKTMLCAVLLAAAVLAYEYTQKPAKVVTIQSQLIDSCSGGRDCIRVVEQNYHSCYANNSKVKDGVATVNKTAMAKCLDVKLGRSFFRID